MAVKTPYERFREVRSLVGAQKLYERLGNQLYGQRVRGGEILSREMRTEARQVRRLLEEEYGPAVGHAAAGGTVGPGGGRFAQKPATTPKRSHFTLAKPRMKLGWTEEELAEMVESDRKPEPLPPPILNVVLDPASREPVGTFQSYADALLAAWHLIDRRRSFKIGPGRRGTISKDEWTRRKLDEQIGHLKLVLGQLQSLTARLQALLQSAERERSKL